MLGIVIMASETSQAVTYPYPLEVYMGKTDDILFKVIGALLVAAPVLYLAAVFYFVGSP